jgi:5-(carboxyamino)imidazole ribonucleotide mutase
MQVAIVFGSPSDKGVMEKAAAVLRDFGADYTAYVVSAHRAPELLEKTIGEIEAAGASVIIAGAGLSAALPGVIASKTLLPVIGVPISGGALNGVDALYSIVQMPRPIPVACVGIDNASNAAYLALEILALKDPGLEQKLKDFRRKTRSEAEAKRDITLLANAQQ